MTRMAGPDPGRRYSRPRRERRPARLAVLAGALLSVLWGVACEAPAPPTASDALPNQVGEPAGIARGSVAERLGIAPGDVTVIAVQARDFPDASLGCPEPGMAYAQVITPGFVVTVEAEGRRFDVRVAGNRGRICHRPKARAIASSTGPALATLVSNAREDLAAKIQVPPETIAVLSTRSLMPGEAQAGCEPACETDDESCGFHIRFAHGSRQYDYAASAAGFTPCPAIDER